MPRTSASVQRSATPSREGPTLPCHCTSATISLTEWQATQLPRDRLEKTLRPSVGSPACPDSEASISPYSPYTTLPGAIASDDAAVATSVSPTAAAITLMSPPMGHRLLLGIP